MSHILIRATTVSDFDSEDFVALFEVDLPKLQALRAETAKLHETLGVSAVETYENLAWFEMKHATNREERKAFSSRVFLAISDERANEISDTCESSRIDGDTLKVLHNGNCWLEGYEKHSDLKVNTSIFNIKDLEA